MLFLKQLIFKYACLKKDLIDKEKFHEAKIAKEITADLQKLQNLMEKLT